MDKEEANKLMHKWKSVLGLYDWRIKLIHDAIPDDMQEQNAEGEVNYQEATKTAVIRILRPDCRGERFIPFNFEKTLIHELLHLKFCLLDESGNDLQDRHVHQLIDDLARAFVEASCKF